MADSQGVQALVPPPSQHSQDVKTHSAMTFSLIDTSHQLSPLHNGTLLRCEGVCSLLQSRKPRFANKFFPIQNQYTF